jgi:hypothetical protein
MWERSLVVLVSIAQIDLNLETAGITHLLGLDSISVYPSFMLKRSNCSRAAGRLAPHNAGHQATINLRFARCRGGAFARPRASARGRRRVRTPWPRHDRLCGSRLGTRCHRGKGISGGVWPRPRAVIWSAIAWKEKPINLRRTVSASTQRAITLRMVSLAGARAFRIVPSELRAG